MTCSPLRPVCFMSAMLLWKFGDGKVKLPQGGLKGFIPKFIAFFFLNKLQYAPCLMMAFVCCLNIELYLLSFMFCHLS